MGTLVAILSALFVFIRSYLEANDTLTRFVSKYQVDASQFQDTQTWVVIVALSILVSVTFFGVALIFIYYQKLFNLYRYQQNFINGFTHELKTPIASLRLYLDTFKRHDLSEDEQNKYLNFMIKDTERLTLNVNQILQIAKIEDKSVKLNLIKIDINEFVQGFLDKNKHYFEEIDIEFIPLKEPLMIEADTELLEMVCMNLMVNAMVHNDSETSTIKIELVLDYDVLEISFTDNGVGIAADEFKKIFKKLYQIGKTTRGSGLGLYLSQLILKLHKGSIKVKSKGKGKGSRFTIALPYEENDEH